MQVMRQKPSPACICHLRLSGDRGTFVLRVVPYWLMQHGCLACLALQSLQGIKNTWVTTSLRGSGVPGFRVLGFRDMLSHDNTLLMLGSSRDAA